MAQRVELMPSLSHHLKEESVHAREYRLTLITGNSSQYRSCTAQHVHTHDCLSEFTALGISLLGA